MADSVSGALDAVLKKLETDVSTLDAKKNSLETEVKTLTSRKDDIQKEISSLQDQQREEEQKLGEFKLKTVAAEQESIKAMQAEREVLDAARAEADAAKEALSSKEQELADREQTVERTRIAQEERGEALNRQAADLEMREKQVLLDREDIDARLARANQMNAEADSKKVTAENIQRENELALVGIEEARKKLSADSDALTAVRDQAAAESATARSNQDDAKKAKQRLEEMSAVLRGEANKFAVMFKEAKDEEKAQIVENALAGYLASLGAEEVQSAA